MEIMVICVLSTFMFLLVLQRLTIEFFLDFLHFPIWWYTGGLKRVFLYCVDLVRRGNYRLAPAIWVKNIFVPMFGQRDWRGRLVSFIMRVANIIVRIFLLLLWIFVAVLVFVFWILLPVLIVFMLLVSLLNG